MDTCHGSQFGPRKSLTVGRLAATWPSMCAVHAGGWVFWMLHPTSFSLYSQQHELARDRVCVDLGVHCRRAPTLSQVGFGENHVVVCVHVTREGLTSTHAYTCKSSTIHTHTYHARMHRHVQPHVHVHANKHVQTCVQVVLHAQPLPPPQVGRSIKGEGDAATSARPQ